MDTETQSETFTGTATYCPEDNKLRLYVGRVPRDEYLKLRADGWTSTPKQSCDFVATWTPSRRDTCLEYAGVIEDEDQPPEERAADRAERFGDYRDKRTSEATERADSYDAGPQVHGYQSQARAERSARGHDRIADRAGDAWSKAEYWQHRTAGVISHALYKSTPGVRMGRIKILEAELRAKVATYEKSARLFALLKNIQTMTDAEQQTHEANRYFRAVYSTREYAHPDAANITTTLEYLLRGEKARPITGAEACALYFSDHQRPDIESNDWANHYRLRLAYELQMLEAQGGRLEQCEVLPGGKLGGKLILKVSKSPATGRATSVKLLGPKVGSGYHYQVGNIPGTEFAEYHFDLERLSPDAYTPPTPESFAELDKIKKQIKAAAPKSEPCPLINPTDADAQRLQDLINERHVARLDDWSKKKFVPAEVCKVAQAVYSEASKGSYAKAETRGLCHDGELENRATNMYSREATEREKRIGPPVCKIRLTGYSPYKIVVLTDKPQKPFPAAVWEKYVPAPVVSETVNA